MITNNHVIETGFILKRFLPQKQKFSVLTQYRGRISLTSVPTKRGESLWPGMLIAYMPQQDFGNTLLASEIEILLSPPNEDVRDIYWIHCLLELCYYLTPLHDPNTRIFKALWLGLFALTRHKDTLPVPLQALEISILRLLCSEFGFYEEHDTIKTFALIEKILGPYVDISQEQALDFLIYYSKEVYSQERKPVLNNLIKNLKSHPYSPRLKNVWRLIDFYSKGQS